MKKNKGFTVVELIASFALTMVITVFLFEVLIEVKGTFTDTSTKTAIQQKASIISKNVENLLKVVENPIICSGNTCDIDGKYIKINSENEILINNQTFKMPDTVSIKNYNLTSDCTLNNDCYLYIKMDLTSGNLNKDYNYDITYYYKPLNDDTKPGVGKNQVTYDISTNGGTSVEINHKYYKENENIDLSVTAIKNGWEFVGWNTNANATEALSGSYPMPNHDITLYAIFSKEVKATFTKGSNVTSIGKTSSTCKMYNKASSCEITLPSITTDSGYVSDGWYKSSTKIGEANSKYNISGNTSLEAKAKTETVDLSISTTTTTNSITVTANASATSGISKYEFSSDNGASWKVGTSNTYTFTGLTQGQSYNIKVRVTSGVGKTAESNKTTTTLNLTKPTFAESGAYPKTVTITYPSGCGSTLTCTYQKDSETAVTVSSTTTTVKFTYNGSLVATVTDGTNTVNSSYSIYIDMHIDRYTLYYNRWNDRQRVWPGYDSQGTGIVSNLMYSNNILYYQVKTNNKITIYWHGWNTGANSNSYFPSILYSCNFYQVYAINNTKNNTYTLYYKNYKNDYERLWTGTSQGYGYVNSVYCNNDTLYYAVQN